MAATTSALKRAMTTSDTRGELRPGTNATAPRLPGNLQSSVDSFVARELTIGRDLLLLTHAALATAYGQLGERKAAEAEGGGAEHNKTAPKTRFCIDVMHLIESIAAPRGLVRSRHALSVVAAIAAISAPKATELP